MKRCGDWLNKTASLPLTFGLQVAIAAPSRRMRLERAWGRL
jgi:hypothetical protein